MVFKRFLAALLLIENTKQGLVLVILTGAPVTVAYEAVETLPLVADKTKKVYQKNQHCILLTECFTYCFSLTDFSNKIVFCSIDFINSTPQSIV